MCQVAASALPSLMRKKLANPLDDDDDEGPNVVVRCAVIATRDDAIRRMTSAPCVIQSQVAPNVLQFLKSINPGKASTSTSSATSVFPPLDLSADQDEAERKLAAWRVSMIKRRLAPTARLYLCSICQVEVCSSCRSICCRDHPLTEKKLVGSDALRPCSCKAIHSSAQFPQPTLCSRQFEVSSSANASSVTVTSSTTCVATTILATLTASSKHHLTHTSSTTTLMTTTSNVKRGSLTTHLDFPDISDPLHAQHVRDTSSTHCGELSVGADSFTSCDRQMSHISYPPEGHPGSGCSSHASCSPGCTPEITDLAVPHVLKRMDYLSPKDVCVVMEKRPIRAPPAHADESIKSCNCVIL